jgi:hypothetical protein
LAHDDKVHKEFAPTIQQPAPPPADFDDFEDNIPF